MKLNLLLILSLFSLSNFAQVSIKGPWTFGLGVSSPNAFTRSSSLNLRYISPRFRWSEDFIEEEEKDPDRYRNMRLMVEVIYTPPMKAFCTAFNAQYRLVDLNRLSVDVYGGYKIFLVTGTDYRIPRSGGKGDAWYMNMGLLMQLDLGVIKPFADVGGDGIFTVGSEFNFHAVYRKPKRRYNLHPKPSRL